MSCYEEDVSETIGALRALLNTVEAMRVPQTVAEAALQILKFAPVIERARAAIQLWEEDGV